jgi:hypothetical protein
MPNGYQVPWIRTIKRTKMEILQERMTEAFELAHKLEREIAGLERTNCGLTCGKCGAIHETEADFAAHYVIPDERYLNLGNCPND